MAILTCFGVICLFLWSVTSGHKINYTIDEETGADFFIGNPATDAELFPENFTKNIEYSVLTEGHQDAKLFHVNSRTSGLFTAVNLDRDVICQFRNPCLLNFEMIASSQFDNIFQKLTISVLLRDINDNEPNFSVKDMFLEVSENSEIGTSVPIDSAIDNDTGDNTVQSYFIESSDIVPFILDVQNFNGRTLVRLVVNGVIDREDIRQYTFNIVAVDGGTSPKTGTATLHVRIMDKNDNPPRFSSPQYNITVDEDIPVNSVILKLNASDADEGENGRVLYRLSSHQSEIVQKSFRIETKTGEITVIRNFIDEASQFYRIIVEASDNASQPLISQTQVFVGIRDTHNKRPEITLSLFSIAHYVEVSESTAIGTVLAIVSVSDPDSGDNGRISCSVNDHSFALMQPDSNVYEYNIELHKRLDREKSEWYIVVLKCHDYGQPNLEANSTLQVHVLDINDNPPQFSKSIYYFSVPENDLNNENNLQVQATDPDKPFTGNITYSLGLTEDTLGYFSIDILTGIINVTKMLDREQSSKTTFKVYAQDDGNPTLTGTALVEIQIEDRNDNGPVFESSMFKFLIPEDQNSDIFVGIVTAIDKDYGKNAKMTFTIPDNRMPFRIDEKGSVFTTRSLDRENIETYIFGVFVTDHGMPPLSSRTNVSVTVQDVNDNQPIFTYPDNDDEVLYVSRNQLPNVPIAQIKASDADAGVNSKLSYYLLRNNDSRLFTIQEYTGELFVNRKLSPMDKGVYELQILVRDNGVPTLSRARRLSVMVGDNPDSQGGKTAQGPIKYYAIAIAISCVTIVLSILIILAIVLIRRKDQRQEKYQESVSSNSTMETMADSSNPDIQINGTYTREVIRKSLIDTRNTLRQTSTDQNKQVLEPSPREPNSRTSSPGTTKPEVISESVSIWEWTENDGTLTKRLKSNTDPKIRFGDGHQNRSACNNIYPTYPISNVQSHSQYYPSYTTFRPDNTEFHLDFPQYTEDV